MTDDTPIDPQDYLYGTRVVDIGDARVKRGKARREFNSCPHLHTTYDPNERRVWCEDCEKTVDPFDAFLSIVENYDKAYKRLLAVRDQALAAKDANIVSRAAKNVDKVWRGKTMAPCCKSCGAGILPEDFADGVSSRIGREMERARRKKEEKS